MPRTTKQGLLLCCTAIAVMSLVVSNIITNKQVNVPLIGWAITCGSICIPLSYIIDDVLAEVYGFKIARSVIFLGFAANAIAVIYFQLTIAAAGIDSFSNQAAFETVLGCTWRTTLASFAAYIVGSLVNAKIMAWMHSRHGEKRLFARCIGSTIVGEFLDMAVFAFLAFWAVLPIEVIIQMIITNSCAKIAVETVLYPVTKRVIGWAKTLKD